MQRLSYTHLTETHARHGPRVGAARHRKGPRPLVRVGAACAAGPVLLLCSAVVVLLAVLFMVILVLVRVVLERLVARMR